VLQTAIDAARADVNRRKKAISDALSHEQSSQAALIKAEATLQNASTSLHDCADEVERDQATFDARLIELGISEAEYRSAIPDIDLIAEMEGSIVEFDRDLAAARGRQTAAKNNVGSAQRPDMEPFRLSCNQAQAAADEASRHSAEAQQKHRSLMDLQTSLAAELEEPAEPRTSFRFIARPRRSLRWAKRAYGRPWRRLPSAPCSTRSWKLQI
jgi:exonuclease SbcC